MVVFGVVGLLLEAVRKAGMFRRNEVSLHCEVGAYLLCMSGLSVRRVSEFGVPGGQGGCQAVGSQVCWATFLVGLRLGGL